MEKILIIDDEDMVRKALKTKFSSDKYEVFEAKTLNKAFGILNSEQKIDVVIVDLRLETTEKEGEETGLKAIGPSTIKSIAEGKLSPKPIVIVLTAYSNIESCKKAIKDGAYDYLDKNTPDVYNRLMKSIEQGLDERDAPEPEEYEDRRWFEEHFDEVVNKYKGKRIAIHNKKVIASSDTIEGLNEILTTKFLGIKPFFIHIPKEG